MQQLFGEAKELAFYARVKNGVVRPIPSSRVDEVISDNQCHLLAVLCAGEAGEVAEYQKLTLLCDICDSDCCTALSLKQLASACILVAIIKVVSCRHRTVARISSAPVGLVDHSRNNSRPYDAIDLLKEKVSTSSRANDFGSLVDTFNKALLSQSQVFLNELTGKPYRDALEWTISDNLAELSPNVPEILQTKAILTDIYTAGRINDTDSVYMDMVHVASERMDRATASMSAWQTSRLLEAARALAMTAEQNAQAEKLRDRKIARLGAVTLFPMLYFAFLGSNIFPDLDFNYELPGWTTMIAALSLAPAFLVLANIWIRRQYDSGDEP